MASLDISAFINFAKLSNFTEYFSKRLSRKLLKKADKVLSSSYGNFAALDSSGNLIDSGHSHVDYITIEIDPTVPSWAKEAEKPIYTYSEILLTPILAAVATSGSYDDLSNKLQASTAIGINSKNYIYVKVGDGLVVNNYGNLQANLVDSFLTSPDNIHIPTEKLVKDSLDEIVLNTSNSIASEYLRAKQAETNIINLCSLINTSINTTFTKYTPSSSLATVATTGSYNDLLNKPVINTEIISQLSIDGTKESMYIELSASATLSYSNPSTGSVKNILLIIKNTSSSEITITIPSTVHRMLETIKISAGKYGEIISTYSSTYGWVVNGGSEI